MAAAKRLLASGMDFHDDLAFVRNQFLTKRSEKEFPYVDEAHNP
jgi:hypothetical protein